MSDPLGGPLHHVAVRVEDVERSLAFYAGFLGLRELRRFEAAGGPRSAWLQAGGVVLMLERALRGRGADEGSAHLLSFSVHDLGEAEARLRAAGVAIDDRTSQTLYFRDPDGHRIGLSDFAFET